MKINIAEIPKGAASLEIDIVETIYKGKTLFEVSRITYYGSPKMILEIQLGEAQVESKGYPGITK